MKFFTSFVLSTIILTGISNAEDSGQSQAENATGKFSTAHWAAAIDSVWGPGLSWSDHKLIWETFWDNMDNLFGAFHGLDTNIWQDVFDRYNQEILDTVSAGRLSAIMNHASLTLREAHALTFDDAVAGTQLLPGVPLMKLGTWGENDHFGAGLTVTLDSSLLVYKAVVNHPLGLVPGDIVLGYDGVAWKDIYPQLLAAELPFATLPGNQWGSTDVSYEYTFLVSAGRNWHLFDTIDVVKYSTGDTLHLATDTLVGQNMTLYGTEQMDIPGVTIPDFFADERISWGIKDGTNIGYIYINSIRAIDVGITITTWLNALDSLQNFYNVDGLIIDWRMFRGAQATIKPVLDYMLDTTMQVLLYEKRCAGGDHFDLCPQPGLTAFTTVNGDNGEYWDRPIALLTGPSARSGGDIFPMVISLHRLAKVFGRPTSGAFTSGPNRPFLFAGWTHWITNGNAYFPADPGNYLARAQFPGPRFPWAEAKYEEVWLTPDGVANGQDDVVEAAIAWILSSDTDGDGIPDTSDNCPYTFNSNQLNTDGDSVGNVCDDDDDNDTVLDSVDNCPLIANTDQADTDGDGLGDACEFTCCFDNLGDVNDDGTDANILDLTYLVDRIFRGGPPAYCDGEADLNGDSSAANILDLTFLVDRIFRGGPAPGPCL